MPAITPDTPAKVIGFVTAGMNPCSHIYVANNATRAMVLCHVDHQTNLEDPANDLSSWIDKVCPGGDYQNLSISIGERPNESRFIIENDIEGTFNSNCCNRVLKILGNNVRLLNSVNIDAANPGEGYSVFINRADTLVQKRTNLNKYEVMAEFLTNYAADVRELTLGDRPLEGSIVRARRRVTRNDERVEYFPPICIFDGTGGRDNCFTIAELEIRDDSINWQRVRHDCVSNETTPPLSEEDHNTHLVRTEKGDIVEATKQVKPKFIDILTKDLSESEKEFISKPKMEVKPAKLLEQKIIAQKTSPKPQITFMAENDHKVDHGDNMIKLIEMINANQIEL